MQKNADTPILIFKHSNTCPVSARAQYEIQQLEQKIDIPFYYVVVQENRDVSDAIAEQTGITHESPQTLILKHGKVQADWSHDDITADNLFEFLIQQ